MVEAERLLVQKLNGYKLREKQETESVRHFVQVSVKALQRYFLNGDEGP